MSRIEKGFKIILPIQSVIVHWMTILLDLSCSPPVSQRVLTHAEEFSGFVDLQILVKLHDRDPFPDAKATVLAKPYQTRTFGDMESGWNSSETVLTP